MKRIQLLVLSALLAASIPAKYAKANPCGVNSVWLRPISVIPFWLQANTSYTFETTNLVSLDPNYSADSVLHVQDTNGNFIAGNDDYNGLASRVDYTPTSNQQVYIIVRSYSYNSAGTGTLNFWQNGASVYTQSITFASQIIDVSASGMAQGTDIMTVEQFNGPRDTVMLINSGGAYHAVAFDDDNGLDLQSFVHLTSACPVGDCKIIVGRYGLAAGTDGFSEVLFDGDVHNGLDPDKDGLGNGLEALFGTNPNLADTDNDGLSDSAEVIGVDSTTLPSKLPLWGANPLSPDLFLEVDWNSCDIVNNPNCGGNADLFQMTGANAATVHSFFDPDINVHLDIGVANPATTAAQWTQWGNWGGATRTAAFTTWCDTLTPARVGLFHHFHVTSDAGTGGGQSVPISTCSYGSSHRRAVAHELGHQIGLSHEGNTGTGKVNSKPNYPSMINYGYAYDDAVSFSRNTQPSLSPTALAETNSPLSSQVLTSLATGTWALKTDPINRKIDWNRDGQYDSQVRGAPTWTNGLAPEMTEAWNDMGLSLWRAPTLARSISPSRLYLFTMHPSDFKMQYRYTTSFSACSGGDANSPCVAWSEPKVISNSVAGSATTGSSAVYRVTVSGQEKMMLAYPDASGTVWYQLGNSSGTWSAPKRVTSTPSDFKVSLVASGAGGNLRLYYKNANTGRINSMDYNSTKDSWSNAAVELDDSGNTIPVNLGLSVVWGISVVAGPSGGTWYMADANSNNAVEIWRYNLSTYRWSKLSNIWVTPQPTTAAAPSLAYVPFSSTDSLTKGQFYLAYHEVGGYNCVRIMKTEGNDPSTSATSRRLQFREASAYFYNYWGTTEGSPSIFYEMGFDTNLRGAVYMVDRTSFFPVSDAIPNITLKDQDDYYYMRNTLSCSLGRGNCIGL
jgi:hypothetical protein